MTYEPREIRIIPPKTMSKKAAYFISFSCCFCLLIVNLVNFGRELVHRNLQVMQNELNTIISEFPRPVMHTFFESVGEDGCCGMSSQGHLNLIKAWENAWQSFGWDTKILNEDDARKHPDFELFELKMNRANVSRYNQRCFWRWLAMAMLDDGGWMSD